MNLKDDGGAGTPLTDDNAPSGQKSDATGRNDAARTRPPTSGFDPHRRFSAALSTDLDLCPSCGAGEIDLWITEGATSCRGRCVECGAELDHREAPEAAERARDEGGRSA